MGEVAAPAFTIYNSPFSRSSTQRATIVRLFTQLRPSIDPYLLLLLALTLLALTPLTAPGYFYDAHDGRHSVFYLMMFDASVRDGAWWPTWAMHHIQGYGYPTFLIQAPVGFYLGAAYAWLGASYTTAVKLTWATGFLAGSWGVYALVCHWLSIGENDTVTERRSQAIDPIRLSAVAAGLLYTFLPYHLVGIYVRAALNDSLLLAWFPWVLLAFDQLLLQGSNAGWPRRLGIAIILLAATLLTHTFALISFAPLLVTYVLFRLLYRLRFPARHRLGGFLGRTILAAFAGMSALLLCMAFLLPLFVEGQYLDQQVYVTNTYDFRRHFVQWGQYFSPFWGFGYSDDPIGANDGMGFQVGLAALLIAIVGCFVPWRRPQSRWLAIYLAGITVALLLFMSPAALPLWEAVPALAVIQFPWRLLALVTITIAPLSGLILHEIIALDAELRPQAAQEQTVGLLLVAGLVIGGSLPYVNAALQPIETWREDGRAVYTFEREHPDMIAYTEWVRERPFTESPMSADYAADTYSESRGYTESLQRLAIIRGVGTVLSNYSRGSSFGGVVWIERAATVRIHLYYFPGWEVTINGEPAFFRIYDRYGLIEVDVPEGEHRIDVRMGTTPIRQTGGVVSGVTLLLVLILLCWPSRRQSKTN